MTSSSEQPIISLLTVSITNENKVTWVSRIKTPQRTLIASFNMSSTFFDFIEDLERLGYWPTIAEAQGSTVVEIEGGRTWRWIVISGQVQPPNIITLPPPRGRPTLENLPTDIELVEELKECSICYEENTQAESVAAQPCRHIYHFECLDEWYGASHTTCPMCRQLIVSIVRFNAL